MQTPQRYQHRLAGLALGVILALLIWPATRWLVRSQIALSIPVPASVAPWSILGTTQNTPTVWKYAQHRYHETATCHPEDFLLQFADAIVVSSTEGSSTSDATIQRLRDLAQRFPDSPSLYANILRFAARDQVRVERDEERWLTGDPAPQTKPVVKEPCNTPEQLAAFDRDAVEGERLDPDNAYFPFMRAVGLFAAHRDNDALAALQSAARKPTWIEYCRDELDGEWKLHEATFGTVGALPRMVYAGAILFPHYREFRAASRVAIAKAGEAEQAGHPEEGLSIRDAVRQCGSLMRVQSTNLIGSLVGIAISQVSLSRPDGAPPIQHTPGAVDDHLREQRVHSYEAYLQRIGHAEKIAAVDAEIQAGVQARTIAKSSLQYSPFNAAPKLAASWVAGIILLSISLWMLALGGGAALLTRHRLIRTGQGVPSSVRLPATLGLFAGGLLAGIEILPKEFPVSYLFLAGILLASLLALTHPGVKRSDGLRKIAAFCLSLSGTALLGSAFAWQLGGSIGPIVQLMWGYGGEGEAPLAPKIYILSVGITALIPLLMLLTFSILSLIFRVPLSVGVVRGLRGCAVPISCILLLAYGVLVPMTLRQEIALEEGMQRTVQHEGRFMAEIAGKSWPGATH